MLSKAFAFKSEIFDFKLATILIKSCSKSNVLLLLNFKELAFSKELEKLVWFTFNPIPITVEEIFVPFKLFSIKIPPIFLFADRMSLGHLIAILGIFSCCKTSKTAKETA